MKIAERLAAVETQVSGLQVMMTETAKDVKEIRDFMLTSKGRFRGSWGTLTILGAIVAGVAALGAHLVTIAGAAPH